jgi:CDP-diacylglycerol--glycerol-3-phosphate 3-phosphatidyltransferase
VAASVADRARDGATVLALPNVLSLLRIALVPLIVVVLTFPGPPARVTAGLIFLAACITDFLDGWIARRHGITTALGQFLDPLADKLLVIAVLIMLAAQPIAPRVPAWMAVVIALREFAVTGLRAIASTGGVVLAAEELGKYKTIVQMFALECLLLHYAWTLPGTSLGVDFHAAGMRFLWVALVLSVWSAVDYYVRTLRRVPLW